MRSTREGDGDGAVAPEVVFFFSPNAPGRVRSYLGPCAARATLVVYVDAINIAFMLCYMQDIHLSTRCTR